MCTSLQTFVSQADEEAGGSLRFSSFTFQWNEKDLNQCTTFGLWF